MAEQIHEQLTFETSLNSPFITSLLSLVKLTHLFSIFKRQAYEVAAEFTPQPEHRDLIISVLKTKFSQDSWIKATLTKALLTIFATKNAHELSTVYYQIDYILQQLKALEKAVNNPQINITTEVKFPLSLFWEFH